MNTKFFVAAIIVLFFGMALTEVSAKVDISGIDVTLSKSAGNMGDTSLEIAPGDTFYVHTKLKNPSKNETSVNVNLEISVNGVKVYNKRNEIGLISGEDYTINISSDDFTYNGLWENNLMKYYCKSKQKVDVRVSGGVSTETNRANLDITGDKLKVSISPEKPTADDRIKVTVKDTDGQELKGVTVKFTNLGDNDVWGNDDASWDDKTDADGVVDVTLSQRSQFRDDPYRIYQLDVFSTDSTNYCKYTTTFDARRSLNIGEPSPINPKAGQKIRIRITSADDRGLGDAALNITGANNFLFMVVTDSLGYATITLDAGNYDIIASKEGYINSEIKRIVVVARGAIGISITPKDQELGKNIIISLMDPNGSAIGGAKVNITKPDSTSESFTTSSDGKITYYPSLAGTYRIRAEGQSYNPTEDEFKAHNSFNMILPNDPRINTDITITVKNQAGNPVGGASVSIQGTALSGVTDPEGKWTFRVQEPKDYAIIVQKEGYADLSKVMTTKGVMILSLSAKEIGLDGSIGISIADEQGNKISADITVTKPDGTKESAGETYTPKNAGNYEVSANRAGFVTVTDRFIVDPMPVLLDSRISGNDLVVQVQSNGLPVPNIPLLVKTGTETIKIFTDKDGSATLDLRGLNITGSVIVTVDEQDYERKTIVQKVEGMGIINYPAVVGIIILVILLIIILISIGRKSRGKKEGAFKETFKPTSLHRV